MKIIMLTTKNGNDLVIMMAKVMVGMNVTVE